MKTILASTCSFRELLTVTKLSLMLLLRTVGSVWAWSPVLLSFSCLFLHLEVSKHWGSIVNSVVSQDFKRLTTLVTEFAGATVLRLLKAFSKGFKDEEVLLSLLNALLKTLGEWAFSVWRRGITSAP